MREVWEWMKTITDCSSRRSVPLGAMCEGQQPVISLQDSSQQHPPTYPHESSPARDSYTAPSKVSGPNGVSEWLLKPSAWKLGHYIQCTLNLSLGQGKAWAVEDILHQSSHKGITSWYAERLQACCQFPPLLRDWWNCSYIWLSAVASFFNPNKVCSFLSPIVRSSSRSAMLHHCILLYFFYIFIFLPIHTIIQLARHHFVATNASEWPIWPGSFLSFYFIFLTSNLLHFALKTAALKDDILNISIQNSKCTYAPSQIIED